MNMKTGDYEWCMACDGEGKLGSTEDGDYRDCDYCGGLGCVPVKKPNPKDYMPPFPHTVHDRNCDFN